MSTIEQIPLSKIRPNPHNPRKRFAGPEFDQFAENIAKVGVLQPILVRPVTDADDNLMAADYEIVFGGRRYAACMQNARKNGGIEKAVIPAQVREIDDDTALDLMTVENLQRDDLTPLEEAQGFKIFVDRFGEERIPDLCERVNLDPRYVRRRLALLKLPKEVLKAWDKGAIQTGHLQQLLRLEDRRDVIEYLQHIIDRSWSVASLKRDIDEMAPPLKWAKFDLEKTGCKGCNRNSDVQKKLFDFDCAEKSVCLYPKCFKRQQNNYFLKNWKKTGYYKRYHTTAHRFRDDYRYDSRHDFYNLAPDSCRGCENFVTTIDLEGKAGSYQQTCTGKSDCYEKACRSAQAKKTAASRSKTHAEPPHPDKPRVSWHGSYFREKFFQAELPRRIEQLTDEEDAILEKSSWGDELDLQADRLVILNLISANKELHAWFARRYGLADEKELGRGWYLLGPDEIFTALLRITDPVSLRMEMRAAAAQGLLTREYFETTRRLVATHIGIDLSSEWSITEEYLQKKTKAEMLKIGEDLGIFADEKAQAYLYETLGKKRGKFASCKAGELRDVFLKCGVELKGKVPAEILAGDEPEPYGGKREMEECTLCGTEFPYDAQVCPNCGAWTCPDCGEQIAKDIAECDCGTTFDDNGYAL